MCVKFSLENLNAVLTPYTPHTLILMKYLSRQECPVITAKKK